MRLRVCIAVMALVGVLAHAAMIARHHVMVLDAHLDRADLVAQLTVICHSGDTGAVPDGTVDVPPPPRKASDCPLCAGLGGATAVLPAMSAIFLVSERASARIAIVAEIAAPRLPAAWPPSRGPPHLV